jgi:CheY-like chemotaxis protein
VKGRILFSHSSFVELLPQKETQNFLELTGFFEGPMLNLSQLCELALPVPHPMEAFAANIGNSEGKAQHDGAGGSVATGHLPRILLICDDPTLQYTRSKVLESAGYAVETARSTLIVEEMFLRGLGLVLLCHTISEDVAARLVNAFARLAPQIAVLRISALNNPEVDKGKAPFVQARPGALLDAIAATLSHH